MKKYKNICSISVVWIGVFLLWCVCIYFSWHFIYLHFIVYWYFLYWDEELQNFAVALRVGEIALYFCHWACLNFAVKIKIISPRCHSRPFISPHFRNIYFLSVFKYLCLYWSVGMAGIMHNSQPSWLQYMMEYTI